MSSRDDAVVVGERAKQLLDDDLVKGAFEGIERLIVEKINTLNISEAEEHILELVRAMQANRRQRQWFSNMVAQGRLTEDALERQGLGRVQRADDPRWH